MAHNVCWDSHITLFLCTIVSTCVLGVACVLLLGAVVPVVLVMSVVVFPSSRFLVSGGCAWGGGSACRFVSVIALRLVLVSFLREMVAGFFCRSRWDDFIQIKKENLLLKGEWFWKMSYLLMNNRKGARRGNI